jgi:hypothetical protein
LGKSEGERKRLVNPKYGILLSRRKRRETCPRSD